jgi:hypothetical protein
MLKHGSGIAKVIATLSNSPPMNITASGLLRLNECQLDIQLYGVQSDGAAVGAILSARNIFLQEPDQATSPYINPQNLTLIHGALDSLSDDANVWEMESKMRDPAMATKLYDAFGSAEPPSHFDTLDVNHKLLTPLKRYLTH